MTRLKAAVIGFGATGARRAGTLGGLPSCQPLVAADRESRLGWVASKAVPGVRFYTDGLARLEREKPDIADFCTRPSTLLPLVRGLLAGPSRTHGLFVEERTRVTALGDLGGGAICLDGALRSLGSRQEYTASVLVGTSEPGHALETFGALRARRGKSV